MTELEKSLESWKTITDENAHYDSIGALVEATVSTSPIIDKLSTWAAAGSAAVAGLSITNIDKMANFYDHSELKVLFSCLAASLLFALFQKYFAMLCSLSISSSTEVRARLAPVIDNFEQHANSIEEMAEKNGLAIKPEFDLMKSISSFQELYPWYIKLVLNRPMNKAKENRNYHHKRMVVTHFWQGMTLFVQYLILVAFVGMSAVYI
ncbi:hypothetical protein [Vibrio aestuarianus]|uniref:Uncharacterized protein n=1 Tax=Vibrio aestuarianus TaxID=28171 RepID=A0A9X4FD11_9VIBR|nr:hypothetical protein [Vibrio aestuarianus]MDE1237083.1 hypothetical protein [Vibrio aestuarianus]MDE1247975.1 hypothetical protein [Vibrio aestuarianus]MDE1348469.1 hypothetical protein [Vibrio aestuarianus]NGZ65123.1 hypothetical protein [Vibrio aestuarianus subsp. cardii]